MTRLGQRLETLDKKNIAEAWQVIVLWPGDPIPEYEPDDNVISVVLRWPEDDPGAERR